MGQDLRMIQLGGNVLKALCNYHESLWKNIIFYIIQYLQAFSFHFYLFSVWLVL